MALYNQKLEQVRAARAAVVAELTVIVLMELLVKQIRAVAVVVVIGKQQVAAPVAPVSSSPAT
jgi:hypothetical protein